MARTLTPALLTLAAVLLASCGSGPSGSAAQPLPPASASPSGLPSDVVGVTWQWVSFTTPVEQLNVDARDRYTIQFDQAGRAALRAGCNRGSASYSVTADQRLTFGPIALTRAACPPGSLSDRFAREVGRASSYFVRDGDLYLELPVDSGTLRFERQG